MKILASLSGWKFSVSHLRVHGCVAGFALFFVAASSISSAAEPSPTNQNTRSKAATTSIGEKSSPAGAEVALELVARKQAFAATKSAADAFDREVLSPKSVIFSEDGKKFYVNSLEGCTTLAYDSRTLEKLATIRHRFGPQDSHLFANGESTAFDYKFPEGIAQPNIFEGKPVESCLSHGGRYLWVTYYRRSFDRNAQYPSALCIIDTRTDKIVRVMPTGPLPKMIASSPDNKWVAVTHWGDNTVGIIDISSNDPADFRYTKHLVVENRMRLDFGTGEAVNRDKNCGCCLRGTVFTPDSRHLLIGKMGKASSGLSVFETEGFKNLGGITGMHHNVRHIAIHGDDLYLSTNITGYVQRCPWRDLIAARQSSSARNISFQNWRSAFVGKGARTIALTPNGDYIFAAVNNHSEIVILRTSDMKILGRIRADSYPVGMAVAPDGSRLIVTAQGVNKAGGNSVGIFAIKTGARSALESTPSAGRACPSPLNPREIKAPNARTEPGAANS